MVSSLRGELGLLLAAAMLSVGCGTTMLSHDEGAALQAAASPAAAPGILGLLPAKRGEPIDPGETTGVLKPRWGLQLGMFGVPPNGGGRFRSPRLAIAALFRLGPDRTHPVGLELSAGNSYLPGNEGDPEYEGAEYFLSGARALFDVGGQELFLVAGIEFVREGASRKGGGRVVWAGVCLELGVYFRVTRRTEVSVLLFRLPENETVMFGSDPTTLMTYGGFRVFF